MPIIWHYVLRQYLKVLTFSVSCFLLALVICQLRRLAQFALLGAGWGEIVKFGLYLVPYVLPVAVPIACLIASLFLFQRLSHGHELVALRASGFGLSQVITPVFFLSILLCMLNFYIASELATHCHLLGIRMKSDKSNVNPLFLLRNAELLHLADAFVDMRTIHVGEELRSVILAVHNGATNRIDLLTADRLYREGDRLCGEQVSIVAPLAGKEDQFDRLIIENAARIWSPTESLSQVLGQTVWQPKNHYLRLRLLQRKLKEERTQVREVHDPVAARELRSSLSRGRAEILRRFSLGLATITFTLLGSSFGIDLTRRRVSRSLLVAVLLATIFLICFLTAGAIGDLLLTSALLYLVPHGFLLALSLHRLHRLSRGRS
jgi:lipopolysaccharide export system permease protein